MRARLLLLLGVTAPALLLAGALGACSSSDPTPAKPLPKTRDPDDTPPPPQDDDPGVINPSPQDSGPGSGRVYANTTDTLYLFEPISKKLTVIGKFSCLNPGEPVIDLAVDRAGAMYATTFDRFLSVDPIDASCVERAVAAPGDTYPNSLSFVPAGTVDPAKEALVGYADVGGVTDQYTRIDTDTGAMTVIGALNPVDATTLWEASGDLISLIQAGNKTYLTVHETDAAVDAFDHLAEVDPATGKLVKILGETGQAHIFGLGYWGGKAYGFAENGQAAEIDVTNGSSKLLLTLATDAGAGSWYGAGVTTLAPTK
jgi:hypothetical protein